MKKRTIEYESVFGGKIYLTLDNDFKINRNSPFLLRKLEEAKRELEGVDLSPLFSSTPKKDSQSK